MKKKYWTIEDSKNIYGIGKHFQEFHFLDIDNNGHLCLKMKDQKIAFKDILNSIYEQLDQTDLTQSPSVTLRIPQLVEYQIRKIVTAFNKAKSALNYDGKFLAVYPIKVNQQAHTVRSVLESNEIEYGLEAGSKAEFLITLEALKNKKNHLTVCNGVKDEEYLELAIRKHHEGFNIAITVETLRELRTIHKLSPDLSNIRLSLRIKPYIPASGHWAHSSGRDSKFGLSIGELQEVLDYLVYTGNEDCIHALHAHIGSQISTLEDFKHLAQYLVGFYNELKLRGFKNLNTLDFGGGLPIDYEGFNTSEQLDTFEVYAQNLIQGILSKITENKHPNILIEAGRAITALSSMIIIQILEIIDIFPQNEVNSESLGIFQEWFREIDKIRTLDDFKEKWGQFFKSDSDLKSILNADIKSLYQHELLIGKIRQKFRNRLAEGFDELSIMENLHDSSINDLFNNANKYAVCNFSLFNSACDHVLVDQYFPIYPIEFLDQQPDTIIRIVDITCDSDGEISIFTTKKNKQLLFTKDNFPISLPNSSLTLRGVPVPGIDRLNESYLVIGLTGAYQDVIEIDHNLFGDLPDVEVILDNNNEWKIRSIAPSESITDLLNKVGHHLPEDYYTISKSSYAKDSWNRPEKSGSTRNRL